jgi:hypothetical protein
VEKRVQQRLGEWVPPPLSAAERAALASERESILSDIRRLEGAAAARRAEAHSARRAGSGGGAGS